MKVLIVYAHPNPKSFNHTILKVVESTLNSAGHETKVKDLYEENFNPVLSGEALVAYSRDQIAQDVRREQQQLLWADALVFIYPMWWYDRPAILKGWFDRVFIEGFAFQLTDRGPQGRLQHRRAMAIITTGGSREDFEEHYAGNWPVSSGTAATLAFCGISNSQDKLLYSIPRCTDEQRKDMLRELRDLCSTF